MWYKVKRIMVWDKQVRPYKWSPWSNTIAYYPFSSNATDATWQTTLSNSWTQDWLGRIFSTTSTLTYSWTIQYINAWVKVNSYPTSWSPRQFGIINNIWTWYYLYHDTATYINKKIFVWSDSSFNVWGTVQFQPTVWTWHNISRWYDWTKTICSIDGVTQTLYNGKWYNFWSTFNITGSSWVDMTISKLIVEKVWWDSTKITNYYNSTKWDYWL